MRISLVTDTTLALPVGALGVLLNSLCKTIKFESKPEPIHIQDCVIKVPQSYHKLPQSLTKSEEEFDEIVIGTSIPYENNFFSDGLGNISILSFFGWNQLTDLPIANGFLYFICAGITQRLGAPTSHEDNTGCINDFLEDKRGVNGGMRAAFVCQQCKEKITDTVRLGDLDNMLEFLSRASRMGRNLLDLSPVVSPQSERFDVFLCHNSTDKPAIREIASFMKNAGIRVWLDEEQLPAGLPWQPEIERQIGQISAAAVFVGESGFGPWQNMEMRAFLSEFVQRGIPVIPVILADSTSVPELPIFLRSMTWIDLRRDADRGIQRLAHSVRPK